MYKFLTSPSLVNKRGDVSVLGVAFELYLVENSSK
jgi:hypothetical protein